MRTWLVDRNAANGSAREQDEIHLTSAYVEHRQRLHARKMNGLEAIPQGSKCRKLASVNVIWTATSSQRVPVAENRARVGIRNPAVFCIARSGGDIR